MLSSITNDVALEVARQRTLWGEQNHPNGTGPETTVGIQEELTSLAVEQYKADNDWRVSCGELTWKHILCEEILEAFAEEDPEALREELVQVVAVGVSWIDAIDRKENNA